MAVQYLTSQFLFSKTEDCTCITCLNIQVFCTLARLLVDEADIVFTALIVQYLNWILLTSPNLAPLRDTLKSQRNNPKLGYVWSCVVEFRETFCRCWMYPTAWLSLSFSDARVDTDCYFFETITQGRQMSGLSLVLFNCFFLLFYSF